jgi:hypothetical protein
MKVSYQKEETVFEDLTPSIPFENIRLQRRKPYESQEIMITFIQLKQERATFGYVIEWSIGPFEIINLLLMRGWIISQWAWLSNRHGLVIFKASRQYAPIVLQEPNQFSCPWPFRKSVESVSTSVSAPRHMAMRFCRRSTHISVSISPWT